MFGTAYTLPTLSITRSDQVEYLKIKVMMISLCSVSDKARLTEIVRYPRLLRFKIDHHSRILEDYFSLEGSIITLERKKSDSWVLLGFEHHFLNLELLGVNLGVFYSMIMIEYYHGRRKLNKIFCDIYSGLIE